MNILEEFQRKAMEIDASSKTITSLMKTAGELMDKQQKLIVEMGELFVKAEVERNRKANLN